MQNTTEWGALILALVERYGAIPFAGVVLIGLAIWRYQRPPEKKSDAEKIPHWLYPHLREPVMRELTEIKVKIDHILNGK